MAIGLFDLSLVTRSLIDRLTTTWNTDPGLWAEEELMPPVPNFTLEFTGLAPDIVRNTPDTDHQCRVSVYLFHVAADKHYRNTFPLGGRAQPTPPQPFALTLYYLVTAYSESSHIYEQQGMSVALKCLHDNPVMVATVPVDKREETFTLTIEPQTVDEIGRLWQAINAPMRLSAVYRVGVVFLKEPTPEAPPVVRHDPGFLDRPDPKHPELDQLAALPMVPDVGGAATDPTGLATIDLPGAGLDAALTEVKIRARSLARVNDAPLGGEFQVAGAERLLLRVPLYTPEGRYLVTVAPTPKKAPLTFSLDVPARIVLARIGTDDLAAFAADDAGFASGVTEVYFGPSPATKLTETTTRDPPDAGEFCLPTGNKNALRLRVPAGSTRSLYFLLVKRGTQTPDFGLWLERPMP